MDGCTLVGRLRYKFMSECVILSFCVSLRSSLFHWFCHSSTPELLTRFLCTTFMCQCQRSWWISFRTPSPSSDKQGTPGFLFRSSFNPCLRTIQKLSPYLNGYPTDSSHALFSVLTTSKPRTRWPSYFNGSTLSLLTPSSSVPFFTPRRPPHSTSSLCSPIPSIYPPIRFGPLFGTDLHIWTLSGRVTPTNLGSLTYVSGLLTGTRLSSSSGSQLGAYGFTLSSPLSSAPLRLPLDHDYPLEIFPPKIPHI